MKVEESILVRRSPEEVFAFFDDRRNDRRWMAAIVESEWLEPAVTTGIGRRGRMVVGNREFTDEVIQYEPGQLVAHRSVSGSLIIRTACIAEPANDGCWVTVGYEPERLPGGILGRMLAPIVARRIRHTYRGDLARLKEILEAEMPAGR